jgi:hypothetical protein
MSVPAASSNCCQHAGKRLVTARVLKRIAHAHSSFRFGTVSSSDGDSQQCLICTKQSGRCSRWDQRHITSKLVKELSCCLSFADFCKTAQCFHAAVCILTIDFPLIALSSRHLCLLYLLSFNDLSIQRLNLPGRQGTMLAGSAKRHRQRPCKRISVATQSA